MKLSKFVEHAKLRQVTASEAVKDDKIFVESSGKLQPLQQQAWSLGMPLPAHVFNFAVEQLRKNKDPAAKKIDGLE